MAITLFGSVTKPATENQTASTANDSIGPTLSLTPPASMQAGDLVFVSVLYRATAGTLDVQTTGGQSWSSGTQRNQSNARLRNFWCVFNGTWSADPVFGLTSGTSPLTARMMVFRSDLSFPTFTVDIAEAGGTVAAPTTPFDTPSPQLTGGASGALAIAVWGTADDNDWTGQTADWTFGRWRNGAGTDQSLAWAYRTLPSAGNYTVTHRQTNLGGDAYARTIMSFVESSNPPTALAAGGATLAAGQAALSVTTPLAAQAQGVASGSAAPITTAFVQRGMAFLLGAGLAVLSVTGGVTALEARGAALADGAATLTLQTVATPLAASGATLASGLATPVTTAFTLRPGGTLAGGSALLSAPGGVTALAASSATLASGRVTGIVLRYARASTTDALSTGRGVLSTTRALQAVGDALPSGTAALTTRLTLGAGSAVVADGRALLTLQADLEPLTASGSALASGVATPVTLGYTLAPAAVLATGSAVLGTGAVVTPLTAQSSALAAGTVTGIVMQLVREGTTQALAGGRAVLTTGRPLTAAGATLATGRALLTTRRALQAAGATVATGRAVVTQQLALRASAGPLAGGRAVLTQRQPLAASGSTLAGGRAAITLRFADLLVARDASLADGSARLDVWPPRVPLTGVRATLLATPAPARALAAVAEAALLDAAAPATLLLTSAPAEPLVAPAPATLLE